MDRLTVLGGGSPFTLGLVEALVADLASPPMELVLYGRDPTVLDLVRRYTAARMGAFGWQVKASTVLEEALLDARYVIHQIRYGGLRGREEDESLSARLGVAADETMGPGALTSALRMAPELRTIAGTIASVAPDAWVLNLTNPLSVSTSILTQQGIRRSVGLCELPAGTVRMIAALLELPPSQLNWGYRGLNHRGFIIDLESDGEDQLPRLLNRLGQGSLNGISAATIAALGVVPTKYFTLLQGSPGPAPGRAEYVRRLRDRIVQELQGAAHVQPPSLRLRQLPWYGESVVPTLAYLRSQEGGRLVVNLCCEDGITREMHAAVSALAVTPQAPPGAPPRAQIFLEQFEIHERRVLEAVADPSYDTVASALSTDPTLEPGAATSLANAVWASYASHAAGMAGSEALT